LASGRFGQSAKPDRDSRSATPIPAPVYGAFADGRQIADAREAKALLAGPGAR